MTNIMTFKEYLKYCNAVKYPREDKIPKCKDLTKEEMLEMGRSKNDWAFQWACGKGDLETAKILFEHGANIHMWNERALIWAKSGNHLDICKWLISNGASIEVASKQEVHLAIWTCAKPIKNILEKEWVEECKEEFKIYTIPSPEGG